MCLASLHIGGLVAIGFDATGRYILTISHSGRGVFDMNTWQRVARDPSPAYPLDGVAVGIGPIAGQSLPVSEINYDDGTLKVKSPNGEFALTYSEGVVTVNSARI